MFSECMIRLVNIGLISLLTNYLDASRFLAQSQSKIAFRPDESHRDDRGQHPRNQRNSRFPPSRFFQRPTGDPYRPAASQVSNLPFASRTSGRPAPLFHSATDEFRDEDDETEHDREVADLYALQKSRRHFDGSYLKESSETDPEGRQSSFDEDQLARDGRPGKGKGIKSSWFGGRESHGARSFLDEPGASMAGDETGEHVHGGARANMVDVGLEDSIGPDPGGNGRLASSDLDNDTSPPAVQQFRLQSRASHIGAESIAPEETDRHPLLDHSRFRSSSDPNGESIGPTTEESPTHDAFWGRLFLISLVGLFATAFLVYLHTFAPSGDKSRWGDTIYMTVHRSLFLLSTYTLVSILISLLWVAVLRSYVRPLVYVVIIAVPIILYTFSLYPFISSFKGTWHGASTQDKVMRFGSFVPFIMASLWVYNVVQGRHSVGKAISILEFACRILTANVELLAFGLGALILVAAWTWIWMLMFTRVFLGGHVTGSKFFVIDPGSWWLGVYFILVYLWSLGVVAGVQRAVTAATVSQWYFHRFASNAPSSRQIVQAATSHALTTLFGTICLSSLLSLMIRLPILILPGRLVSAFTLFAYWFVPTPITTLTSPLSLTYAAIYSQPLSPSARGLTQMPVLSPSGAKSSPPHWFWGHGAKPGSLHSYRLSKLILHAARFMMSLALGFGGWVTSARNLSTSAVGGTTRGSLYAYVVGLIAGTIGWSVLGAMEGVVADIVDASVVCWSSEVGAYGTEARYCREAGWLFGEDSPVEP